MTALNEKYPDDEQPERNPKRQEVFIRFAMEVMEESALAAKELARTSRRLTRKSKDLPRRDDTSESAEIVDPPEGAELLLHLVPRRDREPVLGDLEEDFRTNFLPRFGPDKARQLYWWHAVRSVLSIVLARGWWVIRVAMYGWLISKLGR